MTPCEKLGYKVGGRFEVIEGNCITSRDVGEIYTLFKDDGSDCPQFENEEGNLHYCHLSSLKFIPVKAPSPIAKDPIEYLKSAHENGDMINPEAMLRECFGITKTERVVVEWSEVRREIKRGDTVRIIGDSVIGWPGEYDIGNIATVSDIGSPGYRLHLTGCLRLWFPASSVELV